jgi:hypothetical protein
MIHVLLDAFVEGKSMALRLPCVSMNLLNISGHVN